MEGQVGVGAGARGKTRSSGLASSSPPDSQPDKDAISPSERGLRARRLTAQTLEETLERRAAPGRRRHEGAVHSAVGHFAAALLARSRAALFGAAQRRRRCRGLVRTPARSHPQLRAGAIYANLGS